MKHLGRRHGKRLDKVFSVFLEGPGGGVFGIARNISEGGMLIETLEPYPIGCRLTVTFSLPGSDVEMTAVVEVAHVCFFGPSGARERPFNGIGVRFIEFFSEQPSPAQPLSLELMQ